MLIDRNQKIIRSILYNMCSALYIKFLDAQDSGRDCGYSDKISFENNALQPKQRIGKKAAFNWECKKRNPKWDDDFNL